MISKSLFGNRLREERKKLGLTQVEAAEKCGIERETWGKYERGIFMPGGDVLISFLGLGVNVSYLFSPEEQSRKAESNLAKEERSLLEAYRTASDKAKAALLAMADVIEKK